MQDVFKLSLKTFLDSVQFVYTAHIRLFAYVPLPFKFVYYSLHLYFVYEFLVCFFQFLVLRFKELKKFVYASSSSVYGDSTTLPKKEGQEGNVLSPYALTKKRDEEDGKLYKKLYGLDTCPGLAGGKVREQVRVLGHEGV